MAKKIRVEQVEGVVPYKGATQNMHLNSKSLLFQNRTINPGMPIRIQSGGYYAIKITPKSTWNTTGDWVNLSVTIILANHHGGRASEINFSGYFYSHNIEPLNSATATNPIVDAYKCTLNGEFYLIIKPKNNADVYYAYIGDILSNPANTAANIDDLVTFTATVFYDITPFTLLALPIPLPHERLDSRIYWNGSNRISESTLPLDEKFRHVLSVDKVNSTNSFPSAGSGGLLTLSVSDGNAENSHTPNWGSGVFQLFFRESPKNMIYFRQGTAAGPASSVWEPFVQLYHTGNISTALSNYYTKAEALNLFVGLNSVQTISGTKTFASSPVVPNATLAGHAVNLWQLQNHSHSWSTITDKPTTFAPSSHVHSIGDVTGLQAALSGLASETWTNSNFIPKSHPSFLQVTQAAIDAWNSAGTNAHTHVNKTVLDGITAGHVSVWNGIVAEGIRNNGQAFDYNTSNGIGIADGAYGSESGLFDYSTDHLVVGVLGDYYHYGSADGGYSANGITVGKYTGNVGIGGYNTSIYKALVHGAIAATQGFVHTAHNSRDKVLLSNGNIASAIVDVVNDGGTLRMQDFFADISGSSFIGTDTPHKLVHLYISYDHFELYSLQDGQRIVLINDTGGQCLVKIEDLDAYVIEPKEKVTLYVVNAGNYYFYDASLHTNFTL